MVGNRNAGAFNELAAAVDERLQAKSNYSDVA